MAVIILYELSNVFIVGPVSSTIAEVLAPLQEDISAVMAMTNDRAPFFSLQVQFNEEVGRILSNFTVNIKISYLQTKANISSIEGKLIIIEEKLKIWTKELEKAKQHTTKV